MQLHEAHRSPNKLNFKRSFSRNNIIKLPKIKDKEGILKATTEKLIIFKEIPIRLGVDFSAETVEVGCLWLSQLSVCL